MGVPQTQRRRSVRFQPDPTWPGWLTYNGTRVPALVLDEAKAGCRLAVSTAALAVEVGAECVVSIGPLPNLRAEIVWCKEEGEIRMIGLKYVE